jgi:hypothetical protein
MTVGDPVRESVERDASDTSEAVVAGDRAIAALSQTVTTHQAAAAPSAASADEQSGDEDVDALIDLRIRRDESATTRVITSLQRACMPAPSDRTAAADLADLADAVLADNFAARQSPRRKRH